jgi:creatinine amidohydrolase
MRGETKANSLGAHRAIDRTRILLHELTRVEAAERAPEALVVLPVGATEQHGPHLPLATDWLIVEHVARAAAALARDALDVLVTPTLPFGSSHHHLSFGGTVSMTTERYYGALRDLAESLLTDGFRRIFILNGHGGNHEIIQLVARDLALCHAANLGAASYWDLARARLADAGLAQQGMYPGHAGHFETSLILALRPELVANPLPERDVNEVARVAIPETPFRAERHGFWQRISGHTDTPHQASAEYGRALLAQIVPAVAESFVQFGRFPLE